MPPRSRQWLVNFSNVRVENETDSIEVDEMEQFIPERYNRQSELTREITTDGPNQFTFELQQ